MCGQQGEQGTYKRKQLPGQKLSAATWSLPSVGLPCGNRLGARVEWWPSGSEQRKPLVLLTSNEAVAAAGRLKSELGSFKSFVVEPPREYWLR